MAFTPGTGVASGAQTGKGNGYSSKNNTPRKNSIIIVPHGMDLSSASFEKGYSFKSELARAVIADAVFVKFGQFSKDDATSRVLKVSNIAPDTAVGELDAFFDVSIVVVQYPSIGLCGLVKHVRFTQSICVDRVGDRWDW